MKLFQSLFTPKAEQSFDEKKAAFIAALLKIEEKYILYFNKKLETLSLMLPDQLQNHYVLRQEYEYIRFDYQPDSDLPGYIRKDCDEAYQRIWGNN